MFSMKVVTLRFGKLHLLRIACIVFIYSLSLSSLQAQRQKINQNLLWYYYNLTLQASDKWYWQLEVQERHYINPFAQHQLLLRAHAHRTLGVNGWEASAGFCLFLQNPNDPEATDILTVPELRPHVEVAYKQKLPKLVIDHRYRAEARFFHNTNEERTELTDGYDFGTYRLRYRIQATIPVVTLSEERSLKVKVGDELHMNAGGRPGTNVFDQNRIYASLSLDCNKNITVEAGYLNWYQQRTATEFFNRHIIQFTLAHKIVL
jgi:hypothetical protein